MLFLVEPRGDRRTPAPRRGLPEKIMSSIHDRSGMLRAAPLAFALAAVSAAAQMPPPGILPPAVTVTAVVTTTVPNDRLQAWLRAEAEDASPAAAASQTNAVIAKALAEAKLHPAVKTATAGYSTQQIAEKGKPT